MSAVWKGHITFGMISLPVSIYAAARDTKQGFKMWDKANGCTVNMPKTSVGQLKRDLNHIATKVTDLLSAPGDPAQIRDSVVKCITSASLPGQIVADNLTRAIEVGKGAYIPVEMADIQSFNAPKSASISIDSFVDLADVDPIYFESSYYIVPEEAGKTAYATLAATMQRGLKIGMGKLAMRDKENQVLIRSYQGKLVLHTMFYEEEVRGCEKFDNLQVATPDEAMVGLSLQLLDAMTSPFDLKQYKNKYEEALKAWVEAKKAAHLRDETTTPKPVAELPAPPPTPSLQDMLALSLEAMKAKKAAGAGA